MMLDMNEDTDGIPEEIANDEDSGSLFPMSAFMVATLIEGERQSNARRAAWLARIGVERCYLENCVGVAGVHGTCREHTPPVSR
jgi:hypothetical protein